VDADEGSAAAETVGPTLASETPFQTDVSRIIALSDGVFAFAMTLLVIYLVVPSAPPGSNVPSFSPQLAHLLQQQLGGFVVYGFTFLFLGLYWTSHHRLFRHIRRYDNLLVWLNLTFLMFVAVNPFVFSFFLTYDNTQVGVAVYAAVQACMGGLLAAIWFHATRAPRLVDVDLDERIVRFDRLRTGVSPVMFAFSVGLTFIDVRVAVYWWIVNFVLLMVLGRTGRFRPWR
jgi:uncharacterized membrane protein